MRVILSALVWPDATTMTRHSVCSYDDREAVFIVIPPDLFDLQSPHRYFLALYRCKIQLHGEMRGEGSASFSYFKDLESQLPPIWTD